MLVACDLVRPAAVEQLKQLGEKIGVPVYKENSKDAVKNAKESLAHYLVLPENPQLIAFPFG